MALVETEEKEGIVIATINRPEALNALNQAVLEELLKVVRDTETQPRALILTGAGEKAFVAGADIKEMLPMDAQGMERFCRLGQAVMNALEQAPFPTIAAVNGYALGGGLELALACDFIYASSQAKLGLPEVTLGIIPGFGGTQRLARAVGTRRAKEMVLSAKPITAEEGCNIGLVNAVYNQDELLPKTVETAKAMIAHPAFALSQAKSVINDGYEISLHEALSLERNACTVCFGTEERKHRMEQFLEKRKNNVT